MKLPKITNKQEEILELLYRYRFLDRIQIQTLMNHKDRKTINMWLRDLRAKQYVQWIYSPNDFAAKTKPAIYYIALNGIRHLKTLEWDDDTLIYPIEELRKRYRESSRSQTFIDRCQLIADCCINLEQHNKNSKNSSRDSSARGTTKSYTYVTEADYIDPENDYNFLSESELVNPQLCFVRQERKKNDKKTVESDDPVITNYLLEIFDATLPRYRLKKRLKDYVEYLDNREWEGDDPEPIILLACARLTDLIYAKRGTRRLIAEIWEHDDEDRPHIRFSTIDKLKELGVRGKIWEEA